MSKNIVWTSWATKDLKKIFDFNANLYGSLKFINIVLEIRKQTEILENPKQDFRKIGEIDKSFQHLKRTYRKLVYGNYKITYSIGKSAIYITRVFDTRQNPLKNL